MTHRLRRGLQFRDSAVDPDDEISAAYLATVARWETSILRWHHSRPTNDATEGTNLVIKNIKGLRLRVRNFDDYRLRLLLRCSLLVAVPGRVPGIRSVRTVTRWMSEWLAVLCCARRQKLSAPVTVAAMSRVVKVRCDSSASSEYLACESGKVDGSGGGQGGDVALEQAARVGPVDANHQGRYAEAFVAQIAFAAGFYVVRYGDAQGIDLSVYKAANNSRGTPDPSRTIHLQVKSWSVGTQHPDGTFHYGLEVSAYNYLVGPHSLPHYLALCLVPGNPADYVDGDHDRLACRRAAYWFSLEGRQPVRGVGPENRRVVHVPATNLLTPVTMRALVVGDLSGAVVS